MRSNSNSTTIVRTTPFVTTAIASALSSISGGSVTFANRICDQLATTLE
ncbi:hypothetical protein SP41_66 [Salmonella phage 41]|nr:hypothetical protein SP41_66 [Salmonella phage 41]